MKVLLFTADFESGRVIMREIKQHDHLIVETVDQFDHLMHEIARTTPHLLVGNAPIESEAGQMIIKQVHLSFPNLPVCLISGDLSENRWQQGLRDVLAKPIDPERSHPYADGVRTVFRDESLPPFGDDEINPPEQKEEWEMICSQQEIRFMSQLHTARKNHAAAKAYFQCLVTQQTVLDREIATHMAHGGHKALSWSRDLALKWVALLAHYVPDVELEYLPIPGTPGPNVDFVHHNVNLEGAYAAALVLLSGVKPTVLKPIEELLVARFNGQSDEGLFEFCIKLYGLAKFLEQVGKAHIEIMDVWLDPSISDRPSDAIIRQSEARNAGIYRDFYDLTFVTNPPERLADLLYGFHAGTISVPDRRYLPSFAEFRRLGR